MSAPRPEESHRVGAGEAASPGYAIEESDRAKHVRLRVSVRDGSLIVVIPKGFDRRRIPEVLREKRRWIERARKRVAEQRQQPDSDRTDGLPVLIRLRAVDDEWQIGRAHV
jgi:predicted metal-dependent hydrolase